MFIRLPIGRSIYVNGGGGNRAEGAGRKGGYHELRIMKEQEYGRIHQRLLRELLCCFNSTDSNQHWMGEKEGTASEKAKPHHGGCRNGWHLA